MIGTNCYLVINEETKDTVMVDPGAYPAKLKNAVKEQGLKLKAVQPPVKINGTLSELNEKWYGEDTLVYLDE